MREMLTKGKMGRRKKRLGDLLVDAEVITKEQLETALNEQVKRKEKLGLILVDLGFTTEHEIAEGLCEQLGLEMVSLHALCIPEEIINLVNESVLRKYSFIPFSFGENNPNVLKVAMADPLDIRAIDDLAIITNLQINPVVATPQEVAAAIDRYYGNVEAMKVAEQYTREREEQYGEKNGKKEVLEIDEVSQAPIVRLVTQIVEQAVHKRASDIHIEPMEHQLRIRFRIDGILQEEMRHDISLLPAIVARIKIIGGMDISEKRKSQDGRMTNIVDRREYDIRISILPTVYGEKVVMRLTSKEGLTKTRQELGMLPEDLEKFNAILKHPHGIILVTGPTGSGKSTTLYTVLSELNHDGVNIVTVEDPVEANITGINQVQVNPKANLTFASALRSILRQDPDIIMIGEIRDTETAQIAVKASITGHLVVSTLHTNSAASTITRLSDMGVEDYLIADSVIGVIAQRLVRKLCVHCKAGHEATLEEKKFLGVWNDEHIMIYEPGHVACPYCNGTGYMGRIGVYEVMPVNAKLRHAISNHKTADEINEIAISQGMKVLSKSAASYVCQGVTSIEEMKRITYEEV